MLRWLARRLLGAVATLVGISVVVFIILALGPGDPFARLADVPSAPPELQQRLRADLGLDQPVHIQYFRWVGTILAGQLGYSFVGGIEVRALLAERIPTTLFIMGSAILIALVVGVAVGVTSAVKQYSLLDQVASTFAYVGYALPTFFTALLLIMLLSVHLRLLPMTYSTTIAGSGPAWFLENLKQSAMPIAVIGLYQGAVFTRYVRAAMLEVLHADYVRTARAKGLMELAVIGRHAFRNALIPVVTVVAIELPGLITGSIVVEQIFSLPGVGLLLIRSYDAKDIPVLMAIIMLYAAAVVLANLAADALYGALDPRVRRAS
jgi:peptide/nickel transport system permease protein